jgi:hypothetical protein
MGSSQCFISPAQQLFLPSGPGSQSSEQGAVILFTQHLFLKALSGVGVNKGRCFEIATSLATCGMKLLDGQGARRSSTARDLLEN